jgi:GGDEF domain-containing protein
MFGDANFLKLINDFLGHPTGDIELKNLADIMASCIRTQNKKVEGPEHRLEKTDEEDTVYYGSHLENIITARYGGDEFLIILPNCTKENAELIKNRINFAIEKSIELKKHDSIEKGKDPDDMFFLTVTFGIADTYDLPIPATINNETLEKYFADIVGIASDRMDAEKKERAKNMNEQELLPINAALLGRLYDVNGTEDIETIIRRLRSSNEFRNDKLSKKNIKEM